MRKRLSLGDFLWTISMLDLWSSTESRLSCDHMGNFSEAKAQHLFMCSSFHVASTRSNISISCIGGRLEEVDDQGLLICFGVKFRKVSWLWHLKKEQGAVWVELEFGKAQHTPVETLKSLNRALEFPSSVSMSHLLFILVLPFSYFLQCLGNEDTLCYLT